MAGKSTWTIEIECEGGGNTFHGASEVEFLDGGAISFLDSGGTFRRTTMPYFATKDKTTNTEVAS